MSICSRISLALGLVVIVGCASTPDAATTSLTESGVTESSNWDVRLRSKGALRYEVEFGPFSTTPVGTGAFAASANRDPEPEGETVRFVNDKVMMAFEIRHSSGTVARVRSADEDDGYGKQFGFLNLVESQSYTGSIAVNQRVVGQFSIRRQKSFDNASQAERREGMPAGMVSTSAGDIRVVQRFTAAPGSDTKFGRFLGLPDVPHEEYLLEGRIVGRREKSPVLSVWIDPALPVDAQLCVASAMCVPMVRDAQQESASRTLSLSSSMIRMGQL